MSDGLLHVGHGNYVASGRIIAIAIPKSAPIKRSVQEARDKGLLVDLTNGRRIKSVILTDSNYLVLSAIEPATINGRLENKAQAAISTQQTAVQ